MQNEKKIILETIDGARISVTQFECGSGGANLILIASAAGAPQKYYRKFAEFTSGQFNFDVVTFDYRGIGESLNVPIRNESSKMSDWGSKDLKAIIKWADKRYDKIFLLGHSVAGQIFPKAHNSDRITAAYFVGSQTAYHGYWLGWSWVLVILFWYVVLPITTFLFGYLPGWTLGGNLHLSKPAAKEWSTWGRHPEGILQGNKKVKAQFDRVRMPIHFINIADDKVLAPLGATRALMHYYSNAITTFQHIRPKDLHIKKLGHFGFFSRTHQEKLWSMPILYFTQFVEKLE